jgi:Uma2 family endonuclease
MVVEIISEDDKYSRVRVNCNKYQTRGFRHIYLLDPSDRSVMEWKDGGQICCSTLAGIPVERIWEELDKQYIDQSRV